MGVLLRRCHALGSRCTPMDSLLPVLAWLSEESAEAVPAPGPGPGPGPGPAASSSLPLDQYDSRWLSAPPDALAAAMGADLFDAVLPEPPGLDPPDPLGPPAVEGELLSLEVRDDQVDPPRWCTSTGD